MSKTKTPSTPRTRNKIDWPTNSHFTIDDIQKKHPTIVNITLRFHIKKAEEAGVITLIGKLNPAIGRPRKVYAVANPSQSLLDSAKKAGVVLTSEETNNKTVAAVVAVNVTAQETPSSVQVTPAKAVNA